MIGLTTSRQFCVHILQSCNSYNSQYNGHITINVCKENVQRQQCYIGACAEVCFDETYHQTSNISRTLVGNKSVDLPGVVGASPVGAAPTTSSLLTWHLAGFNILHKDNCKTRGETFQFLGFGVSYIIQFMVYNPSLIFRSLDLKRNQFTKQALMTHGDFMTWKCLLYYWPFVRGIHR